MERILSLHAQRYPKMEPTDAVKLLYQNEFGGGHLIRDEAACLAYLAREYQVTPRDAAYPLWEDIGNGLIRVHLASLPSEELSRLGQAFLVSAQCHQGTLDAFLSKLTLLRQLTAQGVFSFDTDCLDAYLVGYAAQGYPMVSHSSAYRAAYHPAYRVVLADRFL